VTLKFRCLDSIQRAGVVFFLEYGRYLVMVRTSKWLW
jgi:hypothetical protein